MSDTSNFKAAAYTFGGTERESVELPVEIFDGTVNHPAMHQAVKAYLANQRQGTHATRTRGMVTGGNQKPWRQKGTGRARQGSTRAPHWPGGGTVFGPSPRSYTQSLPRKVRVLARKSALNARAAEGSLHVIDAMNIPEPRTADVRRLIRKLGQAERNVLILTDGVKQNVYLSARNLQNVQVMPFDEVSTYNILWSHVVLVEGGALGLSLEGAAEKESAPRRRAAKSAAAKSGAGEGGEVKSRARKPAGTTKSRKEE